MIFSKKNVQVSDEGLGAEMLENVPGAPQDDNIDTIVGPSVSVEGDFASEGNIVVKGTVTGSVHTSKNLVVEAGAKIMANVRAHNAHIAGEVKGNMKIKDSLELSPTARVLGDIDASVMAIAAGALLCGKVTMPGIDQGDVGRSSRSGRGRRNEELTSLSA